jgi:hypothetical protein
MEVEWRGCGRKEGRRDFEVEGHVYILRQKDANLVQEEVQTCLHLRQTALLGSG